MFSVKTLQGTPLRFITSSSRYFFSSSLNSNITTVIDIKSLSLSLNNSPKYSGGVKKTTRWKKKQNEITKKLYGPFLWMVFNYLKARAFLRRQFALTLTSQKFLVLVLSTSEGWKPESTLEPTNDFEHGTPGLGIHHFNH